MKTKEEILSKNNLTVDLVHDKVMTERIYKAMDEYTSEAIAKYEAKQWHYPPELPKKSDEYLTEVRLSNQNQFELIKYDNGWWGRPDELIIRWRELPEPYQPKEGGEG